MTSKRIRTHAKKNKPAPATKTVIEDLYQKWSPGPLKAASSGHVSGPIRVDEFDEDTISISTPDGKAAVSGGGKADYSPSETKIDSDIRNVSEQIARAERQLADDNHQLGTMDYLLSLLRTLDHCHLEDVYMNQLDTPEPGANGLFRPWQVRVRLGTEAGAIRTLIGIGTTPILALLRILTILQMLGRVDSEIPGDLRAIATRLGSSIR